MLVSDEHTEGGLLQPAVTAADLFGASYTGHAPANSGPTTVAGSSQTLTHPTMIPSSRAAASAPARAPFRDTTTP